MATRSRTRRVQTSTGKTFIFTPNPEFAKDHKQDPKFQSFMFRLASEAASIARTHVPDRGFMGIAADKGKLQGRRAGTKLNAGENAQVVFPSPAWHLIEFGTPTHAPYAPLRKGIEGAGMRYQPRGLGEASE